DSQLQSGVGIAGGLGHAAAVVALGVGGAQISAVHAGQVGHPGVGGIPPHLGHDAFHVVAQGGDVAGQQAALTHGNAAHFHAGGDHLGEQVAEVGGGVGAGQDVDALALELVHDVGEVGGVGGILLGIHQGVVLVHPLGEHGVPGGAVSVVGEG